MVPTSAPSASQQTLAQAPQTNSAPRSWLLPQRTLNPTDSCSPPPNPTLTSIHPNTITPHRTPGTRRRVPTSAPSASQQTLAQAPQTNSAPRSWLLPQLTLNPTASRSPPPPIPGLTNIHPGTIGPHRTPGTRRRVPTSAPSASQQTLAQVLQTDSGPRSLLLLPACPHCHSLCF